MSFEKRKKRYKVIKKIFDNRWGIFCLVIFAAGIVFCGLEEQLGLPCSMAFFATIEIALLFQLIGGELVDLWLLREEGELEIIKKVKIQEKRESFAEYVSLIEEAEVKVWQSFLTEKGIKTFSEIKPGKSSKWLLYFAEQFEPTADTIQVAALLVKSIRRYPPIKFKHGGDDDLLTMKIAAIAVGNFLNLFKDQLGISGIDLEKMEKLLVNTFNEGIASVIEECCYKVNE